MTYDDTLADRLAPTAPAPIIPPSARRRSARQPWWLHPSVVVAILAASLVTGLAVGAATLPDDQPEPVASDKMPVVERQVVDLGEPAGGPVVPTTTTTVPAVAERNGTSSATSPADSQHASVSQAAATVVAAEAEPVDEPAPTTTVEQTTTTTTRCQDACADGTDMPCNPTFLWDDGLWHCSRPPFVPTTTTVAQ